MKNSEKIYIGVSFVTTALLFRWALVPFVRANFLGGAIYYPLFLLPAVLACITLLNKKNSLFHSIFGWTVNVILLLLDLAIYVGADPDVSRSTLGLLIAVIVLFGLLAFLGSLVVLVYSAIKRLKLN